MACITFIMSFTSQGFFTRKTITRDPLYGVVYTPCANKTSPTFFVTTCRDAFTAIFGKVSPL